MRIYLFIVFSMFMACRSQSPSYHKMSGQTMGTTYHITCKADRQDNYLKGGIDSLLEDFNQSLSTYIPESHISRFNASQNGITMAKKDDPYFLPVLKLCTEMYESTKGHFDPTIMPLVNFYGFGYVKKKVGESPDLEKLDSVRALVDFNLISYRESRDSFSIVKALPLVELDVNSIAKGYGVDVVAKYLDEQGITDYLVEIGGEVRTKGVSPKGQSWVLGINTPDPMSALTDVILPVFLSGKSMATSGDYRNFYVAGGRKFVHIIDPVTGENKASDVLSASIIAGDCATADALATACIVLGLEKAMQMIEETDGVEGCFITGNNVQGDYDIYYTSGFKNTAI